MKTLNLKQCSIDGYPVDESHIVTINKHGDVKFAPVEWEWNDGNGGAICYNGEAEMKGYELKVMFENEYAQPEDLWMYEDEYYKIIGGQ